MKKLAVFLAMLILIIPFNVRAVSSECIVVMDQNSNRILFSQNKDRVRLIASISKIMTAILAIESDRLGEVVKVDESVLKAYGSGIYIEIGEELTLLDLVYGLMLRSGNDAAVMIAKFVSGSQENFAALMNEKAQEIGMKNTTFNNPSGLDEEKGNYSTAYDMALLMSYAMKNEIFRTVTGTKKYTTKSTYKTYIWNNKNKLLSTYKYATGGKTGFTEKARRTLVTTASYNNLDLVTVTLNDPDDFSTHKSMYENYYNVYKNHLVISKNDFVTDDTYYNGKLYIDNDIYYPVKSGEDSKITSKIILEKKQEYKTGDKVGVVKVYLNSKEVMERDIFVEIEIEKKEEKQGFFQKIFSWFKLW